MNPLPELAPQLKQLRLSGILDSLEVGPDPALCDTPLPCSLGEHRREQPAPGAVDSKSFQAVGSQEGEPVRTAPLCTSPTIDRNDPI